MSSKALAVRADQFDILLPESKAEAIEAFEVNLGGGNISLGDLDKITVTPGGVTIFEVPTIDGTQHPEELQAIVIAAPEQFGYWSKSIDDGGNSAPDCYSLDCIKGIGNPGGLCAVCPKKQWGSDPKGGKGKACKDLRPLFLLFPDAAIPKILSVPPTSLKHVRKYFVRLSGAKVPYFGAITKITLKKEKNEKNIDYCELQFAVVEGGILSKEQRASIKEYVDRMQALIAQTPPTAGVAQAAEAVETGPDGAFEVGQDPAQEADEIFKAE